jgi:hypothetical protein
MITNKPLTFGLIGAAIALAVLIVVLFVMPLVTAPTPPQIPPAYGQTPQQQQHEALAQLSSASTASMNTTTTTTMTEEGEELVSFSTNVTSSTQNITFYTDTDIKTAILGQLFGSNVTDYDLYENGTIKIKGDYIFTELSSNEIDYTQEGLKFKNSGTVILN